MTRQRIVLAYSGTATGAAAIAWLRERQGADVVTLTVDVGQAGDLEEVRARALAAGALRAHVVDARDVFARDHVIPALRQGITDAATLRRLSDPLVAATLVEIAAVESASAIAHTAGDDRAFDDAIERTCRRRGVSLPVVTPAPAGSVAPPPAAGRHARRAPHLLVRPAADPASAPQGPARLEIAFADGVPTSLNGIPMSLQELIESVSLISGHYGIGHDEPWPMPGARVLASAFRAGGGRESARVVLSAGGFTAAAASSPIDPAPVAAGAHER